MSRTWILFAIVFVCCERLTAQGGSEPADTAATASTIDTSFFAKQIYPEMLRVQCNLCHNDNGVASGTGLRFPSLHADNERITAFGLSLIDFVDRDDPQESLLLLMPTNREEHTGGERFKQGSPQESLLLGWINYLASFSVEQEHQARERIARAERIALRPLAIRRLTHSQYNNTVRDLLGDESEPANSFPKEDYIRGFKNQAEAQGISPLLAEAYAKAAERLAINSLRGGDRLGLIPDTPSSPTDEAAAEAFVRHFGRRAFRRPLDDHEVDAYVRLFLHESQRKDDFVSGARIVIEAVLQSPHFLFRVNQADGERQQYAVASRLSYFLWDSMPNDEMLVAASRGEFSTARQIETAARKMLQDPRAKSAMEEFLAQWMRFDRVLTATRDRRRFGRFNSEIAAAMVEETRSLFNFLVWQDRNFMEFFTADYTFVSSGLAQLYGLPQPPEEYARVSYAPNSGRSGVLGHGSFLAGTSKPAETSPTERGLFVRNHFLAHEVPPPPPGVNTSLPDVTEDKPMTNRQRLDVHLNSEACSGCHRLIDPIGFGFEQYDAIGRYREKISLKFGGGRYGTENTKDVGLELDTSAYVQGVENSDFKTPKELGKILAKDEACQRCIVKMLFRYAFGREELAGDQPTIDGMLKRFRDSGFQFRELIVATVTSDLFMQTNISPND